MSNSLNSGIDDYDEENEWIEAEESNRYTFTFASMGLLLLFIVLCCAASSLITYILVTKAANEKISSIHAGYMANVENLLTKQILDAKTDMLKSRTELVKRVNYLEAKTDLLEYCVETSDCNQEAPTIMTIRK